MNKNAFEIYQNFIPFKLPENLLIKVDFIKFHKGVKIFIKFDD